MIGGANTLGTQPARAPSREAVTRRPYWVTATSAAITCALAPAYVVRWHIFFYPTTLLEIAILVTCAAFVVETRVQRSRVLWRGPLTIPTVIFLIAGAISVVVAPDHRAALGLYRAFLVEPIAFAVVVATIVDSRTRVLFLLAGLGVGGLVAGLANSAVVVAALSAHALNVVLAPPVVIYTSANAVALYLVPLAAVGASITLHSSDKWVRGVAGVATLLGVLAVLLSFSRGGYLAMVAVAIGLAFSHRYRWWWLATGVVAVILLLQIPQLATRVATEFDLRSPNNTFVSRVQLWDATFHMLRNHAVFGAGLSGFATLIAPYWNATHTARFNYPHNIVLNFWSTTGVLGVVAFAWILVTGLRVCWRGWRLSDITWRPIHLGIFLALVAFVVHGLVDVPYFKNDLCFEFWTLIAVGWSAVQRSSPQQFHWPLQLSRPS